MYSRTLLLLVATLLLPGHAHRPDTIPDTELRPVRPLFFGDDSTQAPRTSLQYPIVLPKLPFSGDYEAMSDEYEDYEDVYFTVGYVAVPNDVSSTVGYTSEDVTVGIVRDTTDDADELDGQQERLENSTTRNCICWGLIVAGTCLLCIISTFMLS